MITPISRQIRSLLVAFAVSPRSAGGVAPVASRHPSISTVNPRRDLLGRLSRVTGDPPVTSFHRTPFVTVASYLAVSTIAPVHANRPRREALSAKRVNWTCCLTGRVSIRWAAHLSSIQRI